MRKLLLLSATISTAFCLLAGIWILSHGDLSKSDALGMGIGLYFIGKAFFVGPILLVAARKIGD